MVTKLGTFGLALVCALAILFLVVLKSEGADFDKDWLLEDLTCEELRAGYRFNIASLEDLIQHYNGCTLFYQSEAGPPHGDLHCALIKKEGEWLKGYTNDMVAVHNTKCR